MILRTLLGVLSCLLIFGVNLVRICEIGKIISPILRDFYFFCPKQTFKGFLKGLLVF